MSTIKTKQPKIFCILGCLPMTTTKNSIWFYLYF